MKTFIISLLLLLSFNSFASNSMSDNATNESYCSKLFYTGSFMMAKSRGQFTVKRAMKDALKRLEKKFNHKKLFCEDNGGSFSNCKPSIRSNPRRRYIKTAIVRYNCSL